MDTQANGNRDSDLRGSDLMDLGTVLVRDVEEVLKRGRIRGFKLKLGNRVLLDVPVSVGAAGALALAVGAVVLSRLRVEIESDPAPASAEPAAVAASAPAA